MPVVPISASKNEGIDELIDIALETARNKRLPKRQDFCSGAVHRTIHSVAHMIEDHAQRIHVPPRFAATKLVEGDEPMRKALELSQNELEMIEHDVTEMEHELQTDREAALADMRYTFIEKLCSDTVVRMGESKEHRRSVRIDNVLTSKYLAIPIFLLIMMLIFWLTFGVIGKWLSDLLSDGHRLCDERRGGGADGLRHQSGRQVADHQRRVRRRGQRAAVSADHRRAVLLPLHSGRQRLHGARRVCDG